MAKKQKKDGFFRNPATQTIIFSICLFIGMIVQSLFFAPLRRLPGYNIILLAVLAVVSILFVFKTLRSATKGKVIVWGAFTGLLLWTLAGQLIPHYGTPFTSAFPRPFSMFELASFDAVPYLFFFIAILVLGYSAKAISDGLAMIGMVFGSTWAIEMYFRSYSKTVPIEMMPVIANILAALFIIIFIGAVCGIKNTATKERKLFYGYWLYYGFVYAIGALTVFSTPMPEFW